VGISLSFLKQLTPYSIILKENKIILYHFTIVGAVHDIFYGCKCWNGEGGVFALLHLVIIGFAFCSCDGDDDALVTMVVFARCMADSQVQVAMFRGLN